jgi:hypothetical protein
MPKLTLPEQSLLLVDFPDYSRLAVFNFPSMTDCDDIEALHTYWAYYRHEIANLAIASAANLVRVCVGLEQMPEFSPWRMIAAEAGLSRVARKRAGSN